MVAVSNSLEMGVLIFVYEFDLNLSQNLVMSPYRWALPQ